MRTVMDSRAEMIRLRQENAKLRKKNIELRRHYRDLCVRDIEGSNKNIKLRQENIRLRKLNRKFYEHYHHASAKARSATLKLSKLSVTTEYQIRHINFLLWREKKINASQNSEIHAALNMLRDQIEVYKVAREYQKVSARYKAKGFHLEAKVQAIKRRNEK